MRRLSLVFVLFLVSCAPAGQSGAPSSTAASTATSMASRPAASDSGSTLSSGLPVYDHVVILIEENKDYTEIIGSSSAPYINTVLKPEGANFTQMFGEEHFSQGNYFWLFSGSDQAVGFVDRIPSAKNNSAYPFQTANLGRQLIDKGLTFKGYSENLPEIGFTGEYDAATSLYARKHVPWISFANVPNGTTAATSSNLRFSDFPTTPAGFATLPTVSFVIPNLNDDMHNGPVAQSVPAGDAWMKKNINAYYEWAKSNNSLLIVTFDENDDTQGYVGLTNPFINVKTAGPAGLDLQNRIATIFAGAHIKPGDYTEGSGITHVNILRTLEAMYGLPKAGAQQPNAAGGSYTQSGTTFAAIPPMADGYIVTDAFATAP